MPKCTQIAQMPPQSTSTCCKKVQPEAGAKYRERKRQREGGVRAAQQERVCTWGGGDSLPSLAARSSRSAAFLFFLRSLSRAYKIHTLHFSTETRRGPRPLPVPASPLFGSLGKTFCQMQFTSVCFIAAPLNGLRSPYTPLSLTLLDLTPHAVAFFRFWLIKFYAW